MTPLLQQAQPILAHGPGHRRRESAAVADNIPEPCRLHGVNPFDYLLAIATHADAAKLFPRAWPQWNYPKPTPSTDTS